MRPPSWPWPMPTSRCAACLPLLLEACCIAILFWLAPDSDLCSGWTTLHAGHRGSAELLLGSAVAVQDRCLAHLHTYSLSAMSKMPLSIYHGLAAMLMMAAGLQATQHRQPSPLYPECTDAAPFVPYSQVRPSIELDAISTAGRQHALFLQGSDSCHWTDRMAWAAIAQRGLRLGMPSQPASSLCMQASRLGEHCSALLHAYCSLPGQLGPSIPLHTFSSHLACRL